MDYEHKYKGALRRAKKLQETCDSTAVVGWCEYIFPELKESEDEKIKRELRNDLILYVPTPERYIAWLERQGEQKPADKVEPKFHEGEWLQYRNAKPFFVEEITKQGYVNGDSCLPFEWEDEIHLWSIADAKNGDVLVDAYGNIGMFDKCYDFDWMSCCSLGNNGGFQYFTVEHENEKTYPATKEQCDLFFEKMKESGYEWDTENKRLTKI